MVANNEGSSCPIEALSLRGSDKYLIGRFLVSDDGVNLWIWLSAGAWKM